MTKEEINRAVEVYRQWKKKELSKKIRMEWNRNNPTLQVKLPE